MTDCVFCKIVAGEIPAKFVYEDEEIVAFPDIHPQADTHILIVPREHISGLPDVSDEHQKLLGRIQVKIAEIAKDQQVNSGYKVLVNAGRFQEVPHLHFHLLGGNQKGGNN